MLALFIRLKRLGNQAVTRKEITAVIMQLLARKEAVNLCGGKFEKLSKVAKRALKRRVLDNSSWPRFVGPFALITRTREACTSLSTRIIMTELKYVRTVNCRILHDKPASGLQ
mmetsp:Transcript_8725/g.21015  ORF Transcript_8725/g.21015 Transcript_8725/m.21015 type:complete len:113 (+) Transcript_8725:512-850(+)